MRKIINLAKGLAVAGIAAVTLWQPALAELQGPIREQMEYLDFSETMIRDGLYAKSGHDVFNKNKRAFVHGIKEHNAPRIYEPDVYTWELAMAEHRKKLDRLAPPAAPQIAPVTPSTMTPLPILPSGPAPVQLTPVGPQAVIENQQLPSDAQQTMNQMVYRARQRGLYPDRELRAEEIKQKLLNHMNSLGQQQSIPALMPALPPGTRGDSYDSEF
ncbi:MAG: hypothetical protein PWR01_4719 [Clostridiales bacterium]|jgi:hypothetical protein|nr:hypothetical protein [Clostridiales bacterium]MDN5283646.1 hypothetical protein [Candidatus Ozemobacter sp.]